MAMTATFEPTLTLNASAIRAPYNSSAVPSMAESLPSLNFGFEDLRARMNNFTQQFDDFIEKGRRRVLEERNLFRMNIASIQDEQKQKNREISALASKTQQHATSVAAQEAETEEMHNTIATLTAARDEHAANVANIKTKLANSRTIINARKAAQREQAQYLAHQASFNGPELSFWEDYLGLRIEGTGTDDRIRFTFTGCDERREDREAWFELDMSGRSGRCYDVVASRPKLDADRIEKCVQDMCNLENLGGFLKDMRQLIVDQVRFS